MRKPCMALSDPFGTTNIDGGTVWISAKVGVPWLGATVDRIRSLQNAVHA
jgi:hypothetical protein